MLFEHAQSRRHLAMVLFRSASTAPNTPPSTSRHGKRIAAVIDDLERPVAWDFRPIAADGFGDLPVAAGADQLLTSSRCEALDPPPETILTIAVSLDAVASWSRHTAASARDCRTISDRHRGVAWWRVWKATGPRGQVTTIAG
jgi:hypothetical protein